jgi:sarcosine oxidase subunit gamma
MTPAEPDVMPDRSLLSADLSAMMMNASWPGARLVERDSPALVSVRARGDAVASLARALERNALPAPNECHSTRFGDWYWLRPDEWLVAAQPEGIDMLVATLDATICADDGAVVDVSGSRVLLELTGPATRDVLSSCCPLDLHPSVFAPGRCAQSLIAKAPVLLHLVDDTPRWHLFTSPSYADYVIRWLADGLSGVRVWELCQQ